MSSTRPKIDVIPRAGAGCLAFVGVTLLAVAVGDVAKATFEFLPMTLAMGFGALVGGLYWLRAVVRSEKKLTQHYDQKAILGVAARHGGTVTLAQVTFETELDAAEAAEAISRLCGQGIALSELLEDGTVIYRFTGLLDN